MAGGADRPWSIPFEPVHRYRLHRSEVGATRDAVERPGQGPVPTSGRVTLATTGAFQATANVAAGSTRFVARFSAPILIAQRMEPVVAPLDIRTNDDGPSLLMPPAMDMTMPGLVRVSDLLGRMLHEDVLPPHTPQVHLPWSNKTAGMVIITIETGRSPMERASDEALSRTCTRSMSTTNPHSYDLGPSIEAPVKRYVFGLSPSAHFGSTSAWGNR